ncbi:hypothetical protein R6Q59_023458 [Mikania micrantha]
MFVSLAQGKHHRGVWIFAGDAATGVVVEQVAHNGAKAVVENDRGCCRSLLDEGWSSMVDVVNERKVFAGVGVRRIVMGCCSSKGWVMELLLLARQWVVEERVRRSLAKGPTSPKHRGFLLPHDRLSPLEQAPRAITDLLKATAYDCDGMGAATGVITTCSRRRRTTCSRRRCTTMTTAGDGCGAGDEGDAEAGWERRQEE